MITRWVLFVRELLITVKPQKELKSQTKNVDDDPPEQIQKYGIVEQVGE